MKIFGALYQLVTDAAAPAISFYLNKRMKAGKEDASRFPERLGFPSIKRPQGKLVWLHGASVGEAMSVLSLIHALQEKHPSLHIVLTTGTVASARLLSKRLPKNVIHQYIPVDRKPYVERFLDHWKPDLGLWVESELWPNLLNDMRGRKIPSVLLNARMSAKSFCQWQLAKGWIAQMLDTFSLCLAQTPDEEDRFKKLGAKNVRCIGNLKYAAEELFFDPSALSLLQEQIGERPVWLMASTHAGEDEIALAAHRVCAAKHPRLLTVIAPRHEPRSESIAQLIKAQGFSCARRSRGENITPDTHVYLADTMGEMGLLYRLIKLVCIGGSFTWGGHNPIEPAQLGCAIIFGPQMFNFATIAKDFLAHDAAFQIPTAESLPDAILDLLGSAEHRDVLAKNAKSFVAQQSHVLEETLVALSPWLDPITEAQP